MLRLMIKQGLRRRRVKALQYACIMLGIIFNIILLIISGNILFNLFVVLNSNWHIENIQYMQNQTGDMFFMEKSDMIYRFMMILCLFIMIMSIILIAFFNKMWRREVSNIIRINMYLGYNEKKLPVMGLFEIVIDYIFTIPFVVIIANVFWKSIVSNTILSRMFQNTGEVSNLHMFIVIVIYCAVLLIGVLQSSIWAKI